MQKDIEALGGVMKQIMQRGILPGGYVIDFINFAIFWYFLSTFFVSAFALLYYRKYREN